MIDQCFVQHERVYTVDYYMHFFLNSDLINNLSSNTPDTFMINIKVPAIQFAINFKIQCQ